MPDTYENCGLLTHQRHHTKPIKRKKKKWTHWISFREEKNEKKPVNGHVRAPCACVCVNSLCNMVRMIHEQSLRSVLFTFSVENMEFHDDLFLLYCLNNHENRSIIFSAEWNKHANCFLMRIFSIYDLYSLQLIWKNRCIFIIFCFAEIGSNSKKFTNKFNIETITNNRFFSIRSKSYKVNFSLSLTKLTFFFFISTVTSAWFDILNLFGCDCSRDEV